MQLTRFLASALGASSFLLSVAVFHIGGSTGIQLFCLIGVLLFLLLRGAVTLRFLVWFVGLCMLIVATLLAQQQQGGDHGNALKGLMSFSLNLLVVWLGASFVRERTTVIWERYIEGYLWGARLTSVFAILQYVAWVVFHIQSPLLIGIHNNRSFTDMTVVQSNVAGIGRAIAMTAEPSLLALLLLPAAVVYWVRKRYAAFGLVVCAMYATQSLTAVGFLSLFIIGRLVFAKNASGRLMRIFSLLVGAGAAGLIAIVISSGASSDGGQPAGTSIQARALNSAADGSTISRLNSIGSGIKAVAEHPLVGWGMQSEPLQLFLLSEATVFERNDTINSLALSLAAWFGIPVTLYILFVPFGFALLRDAPSEMKLFVLVSTLPALLTLNYYAVYSIWLCIGAATGWVFGKTNRNMKVENAD